MHLYLRWQITYRVHCSNLQKVKQLMIRVKLIGGLGNQLFQYACARSLAIESKSELVLDLSGFEKYKLREPMIKKFPLCDSISFNEKLNRTKYLDRKDKLLRRFYQERGLGYNNKLLKAKKNITISGFFQSEQYFKKYEDIIKKELYPSSLKAEMIRDQLAQVPIAAIHFRRGDYLEKTNFGVCDLSYYKLAIEFLRAKLAEIKFLAFTDDRDWFLKKSGLADEVELAPNDDLSDFDEFCLMSSCDHFITANSSFSWWAAWLGRNTNKIVISPKPWFDSDMLDTTSIVPSTWIEIPKSGMI